MPRYAPNKASLETKKRYFELIRSGVRGAEATREVGVSLSCGSVWFVDAGQVNFVDKPISSRYLSQGDRIEIAHGIRRDEPVKEIAARIGKSYQSVYRELARNRKPDGSYQPWFAHNQAYLRRPPQAAPSRPRCDAARAGGCEAAPAVVAGPDQPLATAPLPGSPGLASVPRDDLRGPSTAGSSSPTLQVSSVRADEQVRSSAAEQVTAAEWLAAHRAAVTEDERHREVTDADVSDSPDQAEDDPAADRSPDSPEHRATEDDTTAAADDDSSGGYGGPDGASAPELAEGDLREVAAYEPRPEAEDDVRTPSADETAAAVQRAQRALAEIRDRDAADAAEERERRAEQLNHWHEHDQAEVEPALGDDDVDQPQTAGMDSE